MGFRALSKIVDGMHQFFTVSRSLLRKLHAGCMPPDSSGVRVLRGQMAVISISGTHDHHWALCYIASTFNLFSSDLI